MVKPFKYQNICFSLIIIIFINKEFNMENNKINQLFKEIKDFIKIIHKNNQLSQEDKIDIVTDVYLQLEKKVTEGKLKLDNYEQYKGYMYISTKNMVNTYLKRKNKLSYTNTVYLEDNQINDNITEISIKSDLNYYLSLIDTQLSNEEKTILEMIKEGENYLSIGNVIGLPEGSISRKVNLLINKISFLLEDKPKLNKNEIEVKTKPIIKKFSKKFKQYKRYIVKSPHKDILLINLNTNEETKFENQRLLTEFLNKPKSTMQFWLKKGDTFTVDNINYKVIYMDKEKVN